MSTLNISLLLLTFVFNSALSITGCVDFSYAGTYTIDIINNGIETYNNVKIEIFKHPLSFTKNTDQISGDNYNIFGQINFNIDHKITIKNCYEGIFNKNKIIYIIDVNNVHWNLSDSTITNFNLIFDKSSYATDTNIQKFLFSADEKTNTEHLDDEIIDGSEMPTLSEIKSSRLINPLVHSLSSEKVTTNTSNLSDEITDELEIPTLRVPKSITSSHIFKELSPLRLYENPLQLYNFLPMLIEPRSWPLFNNTLKNLVRYNIEYPDKTHFIGYGILFNRHIYILGFKNKLVGFDPSKLNIYMKYRGQTFKVRISNINKVDEYKKSINKINIEDSENLISDKINNEIFSHLQLMNTIYNQILNVTNIRVQMKSFFIIGNEETKFYAIKNLIEKNALNLTKCTIKEMTDVICITSNDNKLITPGMIVLLYYPNSTINVIKVIGFISEISPIENKLYIKINLFSTLTIKSYDMINAQYVMKIESKLEDSVTHSDHGIPNPKRLKFSGNISIF